MIFPFRRTRRLAYFFAERSLSPLYTGVCLKLRLIQQYLLIEFHPSICKAGTLSLFHPSTDLQQFSLLHPPHPISIVLTEQSPYAFYAWSHSQQPSNILLPTDDLPFRCHRYAYCRISPVYHVLIHRSQMTSLLF